MGCGEVVPDVDADGGVCAEVDDVPLRVVGVGDVFFVSEAENGVAVVGLERGAVHGVEFVAGGVDNFVDDEMVGY